MTSWSLLSALLACALAASAMADDLCAQPSPEEMAKAAGVTLPARPWHVVDLWWELDKPVEHFTSLEMDVTIDRDVPSTYDLYISPCGIAEVNGLPFYGGLQTNINGWPDKESRTRVSAGKGAIFSRWSKNRTIPIGLDHVRTAGGDCLVESAGYEGEFASVRRPYAWTKGTYTYIVEKGEAEEIAGQPCTWFRCRVRNPQGEVREIGSLRFEGADFTYWAKHAAFVEIYGTAEVPKSGIPKVNITFGWPRLNGRKAGVTKASAYYPDPAKGVSGSPDCAQAKTEGENTVVALGPIFQREAAARRQNLELKPAPL